jgi:putative tricarboxylic transport membrane protein
MGAYVANNAVFDLWIALGIAVVGYFFRRFGVPITPLIIGLILGPMAELQMRRALQISGGDPAALFATPLSKVLYTVLALVIFAPFIWRAIKARNIKYPKQK